MSDPEPKLKQRDGKGRTADEPEAQLLSCLDRFRRMTVLTGAGCSTASGIPDYRDDSGNWKHRVPVQFAEFTGSAETRQRYWAQSFAGWSRMSGALPNAAHLALARLEQAHRIDCLITQNVDNLHRRAGSRNVIDLHGVLHRVRCLGCGAVTDRRDFQNELESLNPEWQASVLRYAPDGDTRLSASDFENFSVPACTTCGGIVKPDVVFFGEAVPVSRVQAASESIRRSDALLIAGSSLMVFSGFRFARFARSLGKPIVIINRGTTRADDLADCKVTADCGTTLSRVARNLTEEANFDARGVGRGLVDSL